MEIHFPHLANGLPAIKSRKKSNFMLKASLAAISLVIALMAFMSSSNAAFIMGDQAELLVTQGEILHVDTERDDIGNLIYFYLVKENVSIYHCQSRTYNMEVMVECVDSDSQ